MKKLFCSLAASCLLLSIASPAKAEWVLADSRITRTFEGDLDGLGFNCLYYEYEYTWIEDLTGQTFTTTYWLNTGVCDFTSRQITPTDFGF